MNTFELLSHLRKLGAELSIHEGRLRCEGPDGAITPALRNELTEREQEILDFLRKAELYLRPELRPIPRAPRDGNLPLSFAQQRLWFLDQFYPSSAMYNISNALLLGGVLNVEALQKALNAIVARHESLRTTFASLDGVPNQVIAESQTVEFSVIDMSDLPDSEREAATQRLLEKESLRPFDLSSDVMLRAALLRLGEEEHILLVVTHHIASDGWSMGVFRRELTAYYNSFSTGESPSLPELPIQYADFAIWQRNWLQGAVMESQLSYWKDQLAGAPPGLELPTDRPRPSARTFDGGRHPLAFSPALSQSLTALSRREGVTLFMTLVAAFKTLLYRYTGQEDVVIGSPIANRDRIEIEGLIGFFVNTLLLRTDLSGNPSFLELISRVRETCFGAYAHQSVPFEKLVEELAPERNLSHSPLFQIMFVLQNAPAGKLELPGLEMTPIDVERTIAKFDLTLSMTGTEQGLIGHLGYNTDLFDATTITRMAEHFQILLEGLVAGPEQRISDIPMLTESEQHRITVEWNDTQMDYPVDLCIHQLFEAQVERTPDAVAVVFEDQQLTYQELNRRANQLSHHLKSLGVGAEVKVGIFMNRSLEMIVALMAILKAGGAYVPLDPASPEKRLAFMLEDLQLHSILTQRELSSTLPEQTVRVICLDDGGAALSHESVENPIGEVKLDNLAYILYTSGSTGKPKGVAVEHGQLLNYVNSIQERLELMPGFSYALVQPLTVDSCVTTIFPPLCTGGSLHMISREESLDPHVLGDYFRRYSIDCLKIAPSHLAALQSASSPGHIFPRKRLILGGEALHWDWVRELTSYASGCTIFNHYGPTEATVGVLTYQVEKDQMDLDYSMTPLGRPIANTQIYILDSHTQPVPIGVSGELYIGGDNVARGYLNRAELTAESFIQDPFSDTSGARLYKTGDVARYLPDGNIEFLGRLDNQVKIRGFRIELGGVETILSQYPGVQEIVVAVREDRPGNRRLVAYIVPDQNQTPTVAELRHFAVEVLPEYMAPSAFVFLDALPLTAHGKVDRRALPKPDQAWLSQEGTLVAPRTPIERQIADIWMEVLDLEAVGIHNNFFVLGGHSLLATQVLSRLRKTFQMELPLRILFELTTIAGLAEHVEARRWIAQNPQSPPNVAEGNLEKIEL